MHSTHSRPASALACFSLTSSSRLGGRTPPSRPAPLSLHSCLSFSVLCHTPRHGRLRRCRSDSVTVVPDAAAERPSQRCAGASKVDPAGKTRKVTVAHGHTQAQCAAHLGPRPGPGNPPIIIDIKPGMFRTSGGAVTSAAIKNQTYESFFKSPRCRVKTGHKATYSRECGAKKEKKEGSQQETGARPGEQDT